MLGGENIHPHPSIGDGFFDFQLISAKQFNFEDVLSATITADSDKYTFWKVERYENDRLDRTYYFYTGRVLTILKSAFILELNLDIYLTYTREIINQLSSKNSIKLKRGTITPAHLNLTKADNAVLLKALSNVENNVAGGDDAYLESKPFPIINYGSNSNLFPLASDGTSLLGQTISILSPKTEFYNTGGTNTIWNFNIYDIRNQTKLMSDMKIEKTPQYSGNIEIIQPSTADDGLKLERINDTLRQAYKINRVYKDKSDLVWKDFNRNVMNGYFAVFRHRDGYIDAYPIIGNFRADITVPVVNAQRVIGNVGPANIYLDGHRANFNIYNSWGEIYDRFIFKKQEYYGDGFLGIFKWSFLAGKNSKLHFYLWEQAQPAGNYVAATGNASVQYQGATYSGKFNYPFMMFYRFTYNDVIGMELANSEKTGSGFTNNPFTLYDGSSNDLIDSYVRLLQPILYQNNQIIPAKYSFLAKGYTVNNRSIKGFTIPICYGFTNGFKLFCNITMYNSAALGLSCGGTLPATTSKYFDQLAAIEQQKNAGIANSVGNLFARPLNWLSGGMTNAITGQFSNLSSDTTSYNQSNVVGFEPGPPTRSNTRNNGWNRTLTNVDNNNIQANIGGIGGFIGDFVNIGNTIKQSEVAKRNIGIGYLSTTDDDMYNAVVNNGYVNQYLNSTYYSLEYGLFSYGFRLIFDNNTFEKYRYYYHNFGFPIDSFVKGNYFSNLLDYRGNTAYFELDRNWCLSELSELKNYNDNVIRKAIIDQLTGGIRMRRYS